MLFSASEELDVICNQIAWLERYTYELDCLSQQPTPEFSGDLEQIINATAPHFFYMTRNLLVYIIYMGIAKLLDPPEQGKGAMKKNNLTLERIVISFTSVGSPQRASAEQLLLKVKDMFSPGLEARNKILAHTDYNCSMDYNNGIIKMNIDQDTIGSIIVKLRLIIEEVAPVNTLPTILPKDDKHWLGARDFIDRLRPTVTS
ncbi:hypothetical protein [Acidithiobacillus sp.]|uniref:hypothetical protein n=1 Tax=Acidithiobacillus sp. TaxID=1872118 RepID=UPI0025C25AEA|nr:hypothetical protein [Acidithiobacillus sp.]